MAKRIALHQVEFTRDLSKKVSSRLGTVNQIEKQKIDFSPIKKLHSRLLNKLLLNVLLQLFFVNTDLLFFPCSKYPRPNNSANF
jgi:hypothetical protein